MRRFYNSGSQWQAVAILAITGDIFVMTGVGRLLASGRWRTFCKVPDNPCYKE